VRKARDYVSATIAPNNAAELEEVQEFLAALAADPSTAENGVSHSELLRVARELE